MKLRTMLDIAVLRIMELPYRSRTTVVFWIGAAVVGLVAVLLAKAAEWSFLLFQLVTRQWHWAPLIILPLGGVFIRWLMTRFGQGSEGSGIPQAMAAIEEASNPDVAGRLLSLRIAAAKFLGIVLGAGSGFVLGREGPTVQIGASIMYACRRFLPLEEPVFQRQLILAGGAAGIAAAFNTPLAGIVFAFEELARSVETSTSGKLIGAVILSGVVSLAFLGNYTYFGRVHAPGFALSILLPLVLVSMTAGVIGGLFSWMCVHQSRWLPESVLIARTRHPYWFVAICGLIIAGAGQIVPIYGSGAAETSAVISGQGVLVWYYMPLKFISLMSTFLTGLPGGIFAPSLSLGAGVGSWFAPLFSPDISVKLMAIGMAAMLSAVTRAPVTSAIILIEMTDGHSMVISTLAAAMLASSVARMFRTNLYHDLAAGILKQVSRQNGQQA